MSWSFKFLNLNKRFINRHCFPFAKMFSDFNRYFTGKNQYNISKTNVYWTQYFSYKKKNLPTNITVYDKRWSEMIRMYIKKIHAYRKQNLMELILFCRLILLLITTLEIYMKRCQFMNSWICKNLIHLWKSTMQIIHYHCGFFFNRVFLSVFYHL